MAVRVEALEGNVAGLDDGDTVPLRAGDPGSRGEILVGYP